MLIGLAAIFLLLGTVTVYADRHLLDSKDFSDRASSTLSDADVRKAIGQRLSDQVVKAQPDLLGARPLIDGAAEGIAGTGAFQALFRRAVEQVHGSVFGREQDSVALRVADIALLVTQALKQVDPSLAKKVPDSVQGELLSISEGSDKAVVDLAQTADGVRSAAVWSIALGIVMLVLALLTAPDRRQAVRRVGLTVAGVGLFLVAALLIGRAVVSDKVGGADGDAIRTVWDAFLLDLRTWGLVLAAAGAVIAACANALREPDDVDDAVRRAWYSLTHPPKTHWRASLRALAIIAIGLLVVAERETMIQLIALLGGLYLVYLGVLELMRVAVPTARWAAGEIDEEIDEAVADARRFGTTRGRVLARRFGPLAGIAAIAGLLIAGAVVAASSTGGDEENAALEIRACNGHAALCDRPLNEISIAATHNSMSAADQPGWVFALQEKAIPSQLAAGARGLLIDTHYGVKTRRGVYTLFNKDSASRAQLADQFGDDFVATAERLRGRIGYRGGGKREVYLCHAYCELGATKAKTGLEWVRDFLVEHPYEVLVLSIEDNVTPEDTAAVFRDSGLLDYVYKGPVDPLPTPREMIESGGRVLVMAERRSGTVPWLHDQFQLTQETPFKFKDPAELASPNSCDPNRGTATAPLFLLNNWVDTSPLGRPSNARRVDAYDTLLERARRCQRERKRLPNLVAVDFYEQGDVFGVVDTLNGVGKKPKGGNEGN